MGFGRAAKLLRVELARITHNASMATEEDDAVDAYRLLFAALDYLPVVANGSRQLSVEITPRRGMKSWTVPGATRAYTQSRALVFVVNQSTINRSADFDVPLHLDGGWQLASALLWTGKTVQHGHWTALLRCGSNWVEYNNEARPVTHGMSTRTARAVLNKHAFLLIYLRPPRTR